MASNPARSSGGEPSSNAQRSAMNLGSSTYAEAVAPNASNTASTPQNNSGSSSQAPAKKRKHRGGKKRRNRRQSFAAPPPAIDESDMANQRPSVADGSQSSSRHNSSFYRLRNHSNTSLESEALLDHRDVGQLQQRRQSIQLPSLFASRPSFNTTSSPFNRSKLSRQHQPSDSDQDDEEETDDRTPLMGTSHKDIRGSPSYGGTSGPSSTGRPLSSGKKDRPRRGSRSSDASSRRAPRPGFASHNSRTNLDDYNINNPPSVPASPVLDPEVLFDDVMLPTGLDHSTSPVLGRLANRSRDVLIDIDEEPGSPKHYPGSTPTSPGKDHEFKRRMTAIKAAEDVCFPIEGMSEIGQDDYMHRPESGDVRGRRRRRRWPDLHVLEAWAQEEKEERTINEMRVRKISEPLMVGGRLRPQKRTWHRDADDAPYRFTYFNEEFVSTVHSQSISELVQEGQTFRSLFIPDPPVIEDSTDDETDDEEMTPLTRDTTLMSANGQSRNGTRTPAPLTPAKPNSSGEQTRSNTPAPASTPKQDQEKPKRYGPRPAWWLDVLCPTEAEMRIISKAFSIHPLTAEDIMMQEQREKVELFKHYYFLNYRTFEQDENSDNYLEPVNLYVVVFREGVISFHFSMTPHPANVRRRIRQLQDYLILSPDWISYGIIDDITDAYAPLIERIEAEVDEIDEAILRLHSAEEEQEAKKLRSSSFNNPHYEKSYAPSDGGREVQESGRDMLRRVGECRKKVMGLYRLLGNKADVIKGFAKRCNEQWDVAPRSEIGLYLGDIQDHIVTMTGNLSHYENLLSRAHSNYLAQINIRMNERQEKTSDILGKLTVLGTIVLPMNVVTGIWGMNCLVPGQDIENLNWFWGITAGLIMFALTSFFIAKRVYGIV
ncbi:magnesium transporter ALR2 [Lojkania enalia]|uniref:Magnesium transporter ALR2 n=1 Tax=Lojkania enalia TaxID=147567 RepID=A0A9P4N9M6_9PLEO|nr:magnesium transporter ALR2 [Didymosphaeria enalia]